jgi:hypothetical protein
MASANDTDWYSFTATSGSATVQLRVAGLSLVSARVGVFNSDLTRIGFDVANGPGQDLTVTLPLLMPGAQYYIRVMEKGGTSFAAGQYRLRIGATPGEPETVTLAGQSPVDDPGTNESFLFATRLNNVSTDGGTAYRAFASLRAGDVDVYRVRSPFPGINQANVLTATVRAFADIAPKVTVTDILGLPVSARLVADGNGLYTVVVANAATNVDYHIAVESRTGASGDYELRAGFRSVVTSPHEVDSGLLTLLNPTKTGRLDVTGSAQIYFRLTSALTPVVGPSIMVRVYDASNHIRFQVLARAGEVVDGVALLGPGCYRVEVSGNGTFLPSVLSGFSLAMALLTDPVGVPPSDPNDPGGTSSDPPPPPPPSGYNYYNDTGYYTWGEQTPSGGA